MGASESCKPLCGHDGGTEHTLPYTPARRDDQVAPLCCMGYKEEHNFQGQWTRGASITGKTLRFDTGQTVALDIVSSTELKMDFQGKKITAKLQDDLSLQWSDGDVWSRLEFNGGAPFVESKMVSGGGFAEPKIVSGIRGTDGVFRKAPIQKRAEELKAEEGLRLVEAKRVEADRLAQEEVTRQAVEEEDQRLARIALRQQRADALEADKEILAKAEKDKEVAEFERKLHSAVNQKDRIDRMHKDQCLEVVFIKGKSTTPVTIRRNILPDGIKFDTPFAGPLKVRVKDVGAYAEELGVERGWLLMTVNGTDLRTMPHEKAYALLEEGMKPLPLT